MLSTTLSLLGLIWKRVFFTSSKVGRKRGLKTQQSLINCNQEGQFIFSATIIKQSNCFTVHATSSHTLRYSCAQGQLVCLMSDRDTRGFKSVPRARSSYMKNGYLLSAQKCTYINESPMHNLLLTSEPNTSYHASCPPKLIHVYNIYKGTIHLLVYM